MAQGNPGGAWPDHTAEVPAAWRMGQKPLGAARPVPLITEIDFG